MSNTETLSKNDTLVLKGMALILLLIHHLFYRNGGLYDDIYLFHDRYLVQEIGMIAKVCVTLFVLLSGYGLAINAENNGVIKDVKVFYFHRFKKLFLNYWFFWLTFVPISIFFFGRSFFDAYSYDIYSQLFLDIFGLHAIFYQYPTMCYNPTWWFYSCIILLYLFFPMLYSWAKKDHLSVVLMAIAVSFVPIPQLATIQFNILAFVIGILMVVGRVPRPHNSIFLVITVFILIVVRSFNSYPLLIDCFISAALVQLYRSIKLYKWISVVLAFIGKHSMNIFLFHTFIFYFWFRDIVYASSNPIIIFITLLAFCIPISMVIEWMKKYTIYKL